MHSVGGNSETIKWLHEQNPKLVACKTNEGITPLELAIKENRRDAIYWLRTVLAVE